MSCSLKAYQTCMYMTSFSSPLMALYVPLVISLCCCFSSFLSFAKFGETKGSTRRMENMHNRGGNEDWIKYHGSYCWDGTITTTFSHHSAKMCRIWMQFPQTRILIHDLIRYLSWLYTNMNNKNCGSHSCQELWSGIDIFTLFWTIAGHN